MKGKNIMPDFDKLNELAGKLEQLTRPGQREEGLFSWCSMTGQIWREIALMWESPSNDRELAAAQARIVELEKYLASARVEAERARCLRIVRDRMEREMPDVNRLTSMVQAIEGGEPCS